MENAKTITRRDGRLSTGKLTVLETSTYRWESAICDVDECTKFNCRAFVDEAKRAFLLRRSCETKFVPEAATA